MAVREFETEVSGHRAFVYKENSFAPDDPYKFYLPFVCGQGCWTVWFGSLAAAKRAFLKEHGGVKTGMDFADCRKCGCGNPRKGFKDFICRAAKHEYAVSFDTKKSKAWL